MKKLLSLILALAMVLSLVTVPAMAATPTVDGTFGITADQATINEGDKVAFTVSATNPTVDSYSATVTAWAWTVGSKLSGTAGTAATTNDLTAVSSGTVTVSCKLTLSYDDGKTTTKTVSESFTIVDKFTVNDLSSIKVNGRTYTDVANVYVYSADGTLTGDDFTVTASGYTLSEKSFASNTLTLKASGVDGTVNITVKTGDLAVSGAADLSTVISKGTTKLTATVTGNKQGDASVTWKYKVKDALDSTYTTLVSKDSVITSVGGGSTPSGTSVYEWTVPSVSSGSKEYTVQYTLYAGSTELSKGTIDVTVVPDAYALNAPSKVTMTSADTVKLFSYTTPVKLYDTGDKTKAALDGVDYRFTSAKPAVVSVGETTGVLTANKTGTAVITVTATYMGKEYTKTVTVTSSALDCEMDDVVNGSKATYSYADLRNAVKDAVNKVYDSSTIKVSDITKLEISGLPASTAAVLKTGTTKSAAAYKVNDEVTKSDDVCIWTEAGYLGTASFKVKATTASATYEVEILVPVVSDDKFDTSVVATENSSGNWTFEVDFTDCKYLYIYKIGTTFSSYDGLYTAETMGNFTRYADGKTFTVGKSSFTNGTCKLYVVSVNSSGVASSGTLTVKQQTYEVEYGTKVDETLTFEQDDFDDLLTEMAKDAGDIKTGKTYPSVEFVNVVFTSLPTSTSGVLYYGTDKVKTTTKCTDLDKVTYAAAKKVDVEIPFTVNALLYANANTTAKTAEEVDYEGVVVISVYEDGDIVYEVDYSEFVDFDEDDFADFYTAKTKGTLEYVTFEEPSAGTLYASYTSAAKNTEADDEDEFYTAAKAGKNDDELNDVTFKADRTPVTEYSVYIPFTAKGTKSNASGTVEIIVNGTLPFTDVEKNHTFYDYIKYCYKNKIMQGKTSTLFQPGVNVTRAQLVVTLYRMAGSPSTYNSQTMSFTDCKNLGTEFQNAIKWGVAKKLINGYGDTFKPTADITRQAMVTILYRYAEMNATGALTGTSGSLASYSDYQKVSSSEEIQKAVKWAVSNKIISGTADGKLNPKGSTTRGACAKILANYDQNF